MNCPKHSKWDTQKVKYQNIHYTSHVMYIYFECNNNVINIQEKTGKMLRGTVDGFQLLTNFKAKMLYLL